MVNEEHQLYNIFVSNFAEVVDELNGPNDHPWEVETSSKNKIVRKVEFVP